MTFMYVHMDCKQIGNMFLTFPSTAHRGPAEEIPAAGLWGEQTEWVGGDDKASAASQQQTCESHIRHWSQ